jgi:hypothetical protein
MTKEVLKQALEALQGSLTPDFLVGQKERKDKSITAIKEALAQTQEPVAWLITDEKINSLQVDSIQRLIDRARHAHMADIKLRINGQDEWHQADWLKHLTRTTPPQSEQEPVAINWGAVHEKLELVWYRELSADEGLDEIQDLVHTHPPQRTEQNFCSRCGKRTADLTIIHTCTPPQENT